MKPDNIGRLRHRVLLQRALRTGDEGGSALVAWETVAVLSAAIDAISGDEIEIADASMGRAILRVTLRYRNDVGPSSRFLVGSRILNVRSALDVDGRQRWLQCQCEEELP